MKDIKSQLNAMKTKAESDPDFLKKFNEDPAAVIRELAGIDLPDSAVQTVLGLIKNNADDVDTNDIEGSVKKLDDAIKAEKPEDGK